MDTQRTKLFDFFSINDRSLKNRAVVAPMTRRSATASGVPTNEMEQYYSAFASGGFGLIITEGTYTDNLYSQTDFNQPGITNDAQQKAWSQIVEKVHQEQALIICQLMHGGALSQCKDETMAPSPIQPKGLKSTEREEWNVAFPIPREMSLEDMETVKDGFVKAAMLARGAGFDGVEIHAANGYLFDQFITPHTNRRTDIYGGTVENRLRFLKEVFWAIKNVVPHDFIIGIRLSESKVNDLTYRWPGGSQMADAIFKGLKDAKVDYFHIAAEGGNWARECRYDDGTSSNSIAKQITRAPIIANGGLHQLEIANNLLTNNHADLIAIGRAAIANPNWPNLIAEGKEPIPFSKDLIKPSLTLAHTRSMQERFLSNV